MIGERKIVWNKKRPRSPIGDPEKAKKEANGPGYLTNGNEGKRSAHPQPKTEEGQIMGQGGSQSTTDAAKGKKKKPSKFPCLRCKDAITKDQRSVQCQTCQLWVHVTCQDILDKLFKILVEPDRYGGVCWNCDCCMASAARLEATARAFETRVKEVEVATAKTASNVRIVNEEVAALRTEFEEEKKRNREAMENRDDKFKSTEKEKQGKQMLSSTG